LKGEERSFGLFMRWPCDGAFFWSRALELRLHSSSATNFPTLTPPILTRILMRRVERPAGTLSKNRSRLVRHLVLVLILKAVLLTLLWHVFVKPNRVKVDGQAMGAHIAGTRLPTHPGEKP
jgi:hypothetical protein